LRFSAGSGAVAYCRRGARHPAVSPSGRRNIGLLNKIRAYALQDQGYDTVEANHQLGFAADERDFTLCADMFKLLNVDQVRLLTNNPKKVEILTKPGLTLWNACR
jgi:GTP cyclohydrolase II